MLTVFLNSFYFVLYYYRYDRKLAFFISLTEGAKIKKKNEVAIKSVIIAFFITVAFAYLGKYLLDAIGVTLNSLKIAGGIILMFIAIDILFEKRKIRREKKLKQLWTKKTMMKLLFSNGYTFYCWAFNASNYYIINGKL